jgi:hypothetical protein
MAKISTKTFNPMAGVNLPGWALEEYGTTAGDLSDIVDSLTKTYERQRGQDIDYAFDMNRLRQDQEQYDDTLEYTKQQNAQEVDLKRREQRRLSAQSKRTHELNQDKLDSDNYWKEAESSRSSLDALFEDFKPDDFDKKIAILESKSSTGNRDINQDIENRLTGATNDKKTYNNRLEAIRVMLPETAGISFDQLPTKTRAKIESYAKESMRGDKWSKNISRMMVDDIFPELSEMNPKEKAIYDLGSKDIALYAQHGYTNAITANDRLEVANTLDEMREKLLKRVFGESREPVKGTWDIDLLSKYAKSSGVDINEAKEQYNSGKLTDEMIIKSLTEGEEEEEPGFFEKLSEITLEEVVGGTVTGLQTAKDVGGETAYGIAKYSVEFFPRVGDALNIALKDPQVKEWIAEGMSPKDARNRRTAELIPRGGVYYRENWFQSDLTAPPQWLIKSQVGDLFGFRDYSSEEMKKLPEKILSPDYATWKANEIQEDYNEALADRASINEKYPGGVVGPDIKKASKEFKKVKSDFKSIVKDLNVLKNTIRKTEKYKKQIDYKVSIKEIERMLKQIKNMKPVYDPEARIKELKGRKSFLEQTIYKYGMEQQGADIERLKKRKGVLKKDISRLKLEEQRDLESQFDELLKNVLLPRLY